MNPTNRNTALVQVEREAWGGSDYDFTTYASMFKNYAPQNFGIMAGDIFSSTLGGHMINKKFTFLTIAQGNQYTLNGGVEDYEWYVTGSPRVDFRFTETFVGASDQVGKGGQEFEFALDRNWLKEPCVIKIEGANLPLIRIIGHPVEISPNSFKYRGKLQTSDPTAWISAEYLQAGRTAVDASTSVSSELNLKGAGLNYSEMYKLQSFIGRYAREISFTDRMIRAEIAAKQNGSNSPTTDKTSIGKGFLFQRNFKNHSGEVVTANGFITSAEARLEDTIMMDREIMMEFGSAEKTFDPDTMREIKVAPGFKQLVRDGHYMAHNGSLSLSGLYEYLMNIFITRRDFSDRTIRLSSGEAGIYFLHQLLAEEAKLYTTIDTHFIRTRTDSQGYNGHELEYGRMRAAA